MKRNVVLLLILFFPRCATAQNSFHWKPWKVGAPERRTSPTTVNRLNLTRQHLNIEFSAPPNSRDLKELEDRGVNIVSVLSARAFVVSAPNSFSAETLPASLNETWAAAFGSEDKASPLIRGRSPRNPYSVVEFHSDVNMGDARAIAIECGLRVIDNPDLLPNDLLVEGSTAQVANLTTWDEVAYVYPASGDLGRGIKVNACAGALTSQGTVSTGVPTVGDGWDGPGQNSAALNYVFGQLSSRLPADTQKSEIVRALSEWAKHAAVTFTASDNASGRGTIAILFATGAHGDNYPFTSGGMLAHTFYPYPLNPESIAGDLHLNDSENWQVGTDTDLFSVVLHEIGHALGLGHSDNPADVMYPYYRRLTGLSQGDIAAIQELYAAPSTATPPPSTAPAPLIIAVQLPPSTVSGSSITISGTVTGGSGNVQVSWMNGVSGGVAQGSRSWSASILLAPGANSIVLTAVDAQQNTASTTLNITRQQPAASTTIQITAPSTAGAYTSTASTITVSGVATDASGIDRVSWVNGSGGIGVAAGTTSWTAGPIGLSNGQNSIVVTAYGKTGGSASQTITISYTAPPPPSSTPPPPQSGPDKTAPTLTITSPSSTNISTAASSIVISGTATDNIGVSGVTWTSSTSGSGNCSGTTKWQSPSIPLLVGTNTITIQASDAAGNVSWRSVMVTRSSP